MTKDELKKIIIDELTVLSEKKTYRKITFRNGKMKLTQPSRPQKAKQLLDKFLKENP